MQQTLNLPTCCVEQVSLAKDRVTFCQAARRHGAQNVCWDSPPRRLCMHARAADTNQHQASCEVALCAGLILCKPCCSICGSRSTAAAQPHAQTQHSRTHSRSTAAAQPQQSRSTAARTEAKLLIANLHALQKQHLWLPDASILSGSSAAKCHSVGSITCTSVSPCQH